MTDRSEVLIARDLTKTYPIRRGILFRRQVAAVRAVDGVSFSLRAGQTLAVVGESGCGKSTMGRLLLGLERPTSGSVSVTGDDLAGLSPRELRRKRRDIQIVMQDPYASLNPRMTVASIVGEPFRIHPDALPGGRGRTQAVAELLAQVGLSPDLGNRYPHQFSGGQRQRIGVARAIALRPAVVVADEPVSALDSSVQAQVVNLMLDLRDELGLAYVFISHDLAVVRQIADRVAVMYLGRIVETGDRDAVFDRAAHPYTAGLLASASGARGRHEMEGEVPDAIELPSGCRFRTRCPRARSRCAEAEPELLPAAGADGSDHLVACYFPLLAQG